MQIGGQLKINWREPQEDLCKPRSRRAAKYVVSYMLLTGFVWILSFQDHATQVSNVLVSFYIITIRPTTILNYFTNNRLVLLANMQT